MQSTTKPDESLSTLNEIFIRALKALGELGEGDFACKLAGEAWSKLKDEHPEQAHKLNLALHVLTKPKKQAPAPVAPEHSVDLEVRHLVPAERHKLILETCTKLPKGHAIVLINDHDPKPLYYQFEAEYPGQFGFAYLESGPTVWRVQIARK